MIPIPNPRATVPSVSVELLATSTGNVQWGAVSGVTASEITVRTFRIGAAPGSGTAYVTLDYS